MRNQISKEKKIQELLEARERVRGKLEKVEAIFQEKKATRSFGLVIRAPVIKQLTMNAMFF